MKGNILTTDMDSNNFNNVLAYINQIEKNSLVFDHSVKIRFLRNFTIETIEPYIKFHLYQLGINPSVSFSNYGAINQEILDSTSYLSIENPDITVLSLLYHMNDVTTTDQLDEIKNEIFNLFDLLVKTTNSLILVNTLISPFYSSLSNTNNSYNLQHHYSSLNYFIREYVAKCSKRFYLIDWERYLRLYGEYECMDYRYWYMSKAPFKKRFLNLYAQDISRIIKALKGKMKKCLVLDCDNTLWGGIIGEDGLEGIKLDNYEYPGKIYQDFQKTILSFFNQGILIVLCSKNSEEDVFQVLDNHPACLLKREHLSAYRINWQDKASNIESLADELNIGIDSFVFVDDSHVECELVKKLLPDLTVLQVPSDLFTYPQLLLKENLFDCLSVSEDDKKRTKRYQQENSRRLSAKKFETIEEYFSSLKLTLKIHHAKNSEFSRIAQLTQKTNQFNLSMRRYTEHDIQRFHDSDKSDIYSLWASDRFGDYGLTGAIIAHNDGGFVKLDSMLLSCRVLSRRIEYAFISHCFQLLNQQWRHYRWQADFVPTKRNSQVKDFIESIGFSFIKEQETKHIYELEGMPTVQNIDFIHIKSENYL